MHFKKGDFEIEIDFLILVIVISSIVSVVYMLTQ